MEANEQRQLGRAKNAILEYFERRLSVPKIYIDAEWAGQKVDVLAIDRAGVGDVHVVLLFGSAHPESAEDLVNALEQKIAPCMSALWKIPAQFKYIGAVETSESGGIALPGFPPAILDEAYSADGLGRIGFLSIDFRAGDQLAVQPVFKPERFRAKVLDLADKFVLEHTADWEIRDSPVV